LDCDPERWRFMALKKLWIKLTIIVLIVGSACANQITNLESILMMPLTSNVLASLPTRDCSTQDTAFLGCMGSFFLGNANDVKFHFTDDLWYSATGLEPNVPISEFMASRFRDMMCDEVITNRVFTSFSRMTTNNVHVIDSVMIDSIGVRQATNNFRVVFVLTNGMWRADDLMLGGSSVRSNEGF